MSNETKSTGLVKALSYLGNLSDRGNLNGLSQHDLVVLRDCFTSGVSVGELQDALKYSADSDPSQLLTSADRDVLVRGTEKKVYLITYLRSADVRTAYPIQPQELEGVKQAFNKGEYKLAVSALQRAIDAGLEKGAKTRRIVVELGTLKTRDQAKDGLNRLMELLPHSFKSLNLTPVETKETFDLTVQNCVIKGYNSRHVRNAGRYVSWCLFNGRSYEAVKEVPGITVVPKPGHA